MADGWFSMNSYKLPNLGKEEELWRLAARLSLCERRCSYSVTLFFLQLSVSSSSMCRSLIPLVPCSPSSFLNQTLTGGGAAFSRQSCPPPPPFPGLYSNRGSANGAPREFPSAGSDPILHGPWRRREFVKCLNVSGGQEFAFGAVKKGPRRNSGLFYRFSRTCLRLPELIST